MMVAGSKSGTADQNHSARSLSGRLFDANHAIELLTGKDDPKDIQTKVLTKYSDNRTLRSTKNTTKPSQGTPPAVVAHCFKLGPTNG